MVSEHDNRQDQKDFFLKGYNEMLRRIEPEKIICYDTSFPEMQGDIVFIDYERSSWKHMDEDPYVSSKYAKYISGEEPLPAGSNLIIKCAYVVSENNGDYNSIIQTGMGSAYGGQWKPKKPEDERFLGEPGEIKTTYKNNYRIDTKWERMVVQYVRGIMLTTTGPINIRIRMTTILIGIQIEEILCRDRLSIIQTDHLNSKGLRR